MDWFSDIGRRFWQAYTDGLVMTCPMHRVVCDGEELTAKDSPCHIDMRQHDVAFSIQQSTAGRH